MYDDRYSLKLSGSSPGQLIVQLQMPGCKAVTRNVNIDFVQAEQGWMPVAAVGVEGAPSLSLDRAIAQVLAELEREPREPTGEIIIDWRSPVSDSPTVPAR